MHRSRYDHVPAGSLCLKMLSTGLEYWGTSSFIPNFWHWILRKTAAYLQVWTISDPNKVRNCFPGSFTCHWPNSATLCHRLGALSAASSELCYHLRRNLIKFAPATSDLSNFLEKLAIFTKKNQWIACSTLQVLSTLWAGQSLVSPCNSLPRWKVVFWFP